MNKAKTIVLGASHWHVPLYADSFARRHDLVGVSDPAPSASSTLQTVERPLLSSWQGVLAAHETPSWHTLRDARA